MVRLSRQAMQKALGLRAYITQLHAAGDSRLAQMYKERYWNTAIFDAITQLSVIADKAGIPLTELALRWLVSKPAAGPILLGGSKVAHLQSNIAAVAKGTLDDELIDACDEVGSALRGPMPNYNR